MEAWNRLLHAAREILAAEDAWTRLCARDSSITERVAAVARLGEARQKLRDALAAAPETENRGAPE